MAHIQHLSTTLGDIQIVQAQPVDVETIRDIYEEVGQWLLSRGLRQWLPEDFSQERTLESIEHGHFYLVQIQQGTAVEAIGMLSLHWSDTFIWGNVPPDAGYVHSLAIRRAWAGQNIGSTLLAWAGDQVLREGREYLRLDCWSDNFALCRYYERVGFTFKGFKIFQGKGQEWRASLYEKKLT